MRLFKYTHACIRLECDGRTLVIDPGIWAEDAAFVGVDDVLITHEHFDHVDVARLTAAVAANPELRVYTHASVAVGLTGLGDAVVTVAPGEDFQAAGLPVRAVGGAHAEIYAGAPGIPNLGFLVDTGDGHLYHPGDALFVPAERVSTLLVPTSGPWLKLAEAIDFVRAVGPRRAYSIHDALFEERGLQIVDRWIGSNTEAGYARIPIGEAVDLD